MLAVAMFDRCRVLSPGAGDPATARRGAAQATTARLEVGAFPMSRHTGREGRWSAEGLAQLCPVIRHRVAHLFTFGGRLVTCGHVTCSRR